MVWRWRMTSLTDRLNKPIRDPSGDEVAKLDDLVVRIPQSGQNGHDRTNGSNGSRSATTGPLEVYPPVIGLVAQVKGPRSSRNVFIPWDKVQRLDESGAQLKTPAVNLQRFARREGEIVLRRGLFDRQVVDVEGRRIVRINDLDLALADGVYRLVAVDVGPGALLRRLVGPRLSGRVSSLVGREVGARPQLIDWAQV